MITGGTFGGEQRSVCGCLWGVLTVVRDVGGDVAVGLAGLCELELNLPPEMSDD